MRRLSVIAAVILLLVRPASALFDTDDRVPAATLLLPYFIVDLTDANGMQTTFTVRNAGPAETLAHVTLWSPNGAAFQVFDLYLSGYDVQEIRLADVLEGPPPFNPFCTGKTTTTTLVPRGFPPVVTGFVTIDNVSECSTATPDDEGYFISGGFGIANNDNVLWGDYQLTHRSEGVSFGEGLVSLEAVQTAKPLQRGGGFPIPTFYTTLAGTKGADQRERLSPRWGGRFDVSGGARNDVILWRDSANQVCVLPCAVPRGIEPPAITILAVDGNGGTTDLTGFAAFPSISNRVTLDSRDLPVPFDSGWLFLDANGTSVLSLEADLTPRGVLLESQAHLTILRWSPDGSAATASRGVDLRSQPVPTVE